MIPAEVRAVVIGGGAIGRTVVEALRAGRIPGVRPVAIVDDQPLPDLGVPQLPLTEALDLADLVVECASQDVVAKHAAGILARGIDLVITSVGALADAGTEAALAAAGPGRFLLTSGAAGGLDILSAAAAQAPFTRVELTTTKLPTTLVQPWMDAETSARLAAGDQCVQVFAGGGREATRLFPRSLNLVVTLGWAVGDIDLVAVRLLGDPAATRTRHHIEADGPCGSYRFDIENLPSAENPRTSGVVPHAVLRTLAVLAGRPAGVV
ncbi:MAG: DUF108 domain-containing protein [Nocardioidaceae bacterium]|nr:DUF108 domain-containing protein [Nocardioidaceae bacterium]